MPPKRPAKAASADKKPATTQRTYRFDTELFDRFEEDCAKNLANPKLVIEAAILYYLDGDVKLRQRIAKRHMDAFGTSSGYRSSAPGSE